MQVEFRNIHKRFGSVHANKGITLNIPGGCIQGLLGENGAGKSTLMKVLSGFITSDEGEILLDGRAVTIPSPAGAIEQGIGMLHQDPLDFPPLRVLDNLLIGGRRGLIPDRRAALKALKEIEAQFGFSLDPDAYVDTLTVGERQQLELIRLLWLGARVLILDEPTTGISAPQKVKLFAALRKLSAEGRTIIFVTHKLEEVYQLCHRAAVLRAGALVAEIEPPYHTENFINAMFGGEIPTPPRQPSPTTAPLLALKGVTVEDARLQVGPIDLTVKAGEVIGLAGMEGSGQDLLLRLCAGLLRPTGGEIALGGRALQNATYHQFLRNRVKFMPADRMTEGLVAGLSLTEHFALNAEVHGFFINYKQAEQTAVERIAEYSIRGFPESPVESLSGGNQQRTLLALLSAPLHLLLLEHPTRGLDLESAVYIWKRLKERARSDGTAILFISSDLDEVLQYSDRVLVFFAGRASVPLSAMQTSVEELGLLIGGVPLETARSTAGMHQPEALSR